MTFYTGYWTTVAREIPFSFIQVRARVRVRVS